LKKCAPKHEVEDYFKNKSNKMIIVYKDVSPNIKSENFENIMESHIDDKYINLNIANT